MVHKEKILPKAKLMNQCLLCDFRTKDRQYMKRHIETIHLGKKSYHCNICDKNFTLPQNLTQHKAIVHEGKKDKKV